MDDFYIMALIQNNNIRLISQNEESMCDSEMCTPIRRGKHTPTLIAPITSLFNKIRVHCFVRRRAGDKWRPQVDNLSRVSHNRCVISDARDYDVTPSSFNTETDKSER